MPLLFLFYLFLFSLMSSKDLIDPTLPFKFQLRQLIVHKNGDKYIVLGLPDEYRIEESGKPAYAYKRISDDGKLFGSKWVRAQDVMEDEGRFTATGFMALDCVLEEQKG